jgi:AbrB family looped-hinge helix DNA binding protein
MTATIYGRGQMVIPAKARKAAGIQKGDVFAVEAEGPGKLVLLRMEVPRPARYRIVKRRGRHAIAVGGRRITHEEIKRLQEELSV